MPPQSTPVSSPFCTPSVHVAIDKYIHIYDISIQTRHLNYNENNHYFDFLVPVVVVAGGVAIDVETGVVVDDREDVEAACFVK